MIRKVRKLKVGEEIGTKEVLRYRFSRGNSDYYEVICSDCKIKDVMTGQAILRGRPCRRCHRIRLGKIPLTFTWRSKHD